MPILLKLYRCFCHDLKICMWFGYYPEIIFCHFFCNLNLVIFKCTIMAGDINSLNLLVISETWAAQWLGGRLLDLRPRGHGLESHQHHCVVSLSKTQLSLLSTGSNQKYPSRHN